MSVYYRRQHVFSKAERKLIATVASTSAIAMRNQRLLRERMTNARILLHDLRQAAGGVAEGAMKALRGFPDTQTEVPALTAIALKQPIQALAERSDLFSVICSALRPRVSAQIPKIVNFKRSVQLTKSAII